MRETKRSGTLLVVSGPSGVGKGTVCKALQQQRPELRLSVSATTRAPRPGETEGVNYYFKTKEAFLAMREAGEFLESFEIYGNYYGTPKRPVFDQLAEGNDVVLEIDMQGGLAVKRAFPEAVTVFVLPPSVEELVSRLRGRGTESQESFEVRTAAARKEIEKCNFYDYAVLNDSIDHAVCAIINIIEAEKLRVKRNERWIAELLGGNTL